jgi:hypothetical protein
MIRLTRPSPLSIAPTLMAWVLASGITTITAVAQTQEEFELQNGRRVPAESVKVTPTGFSATLTVGTAIQPIDFTAKDVVRATLREPKEIVEARILIASNKPEKALEALAKAEPTLLPYQSIPDSWWLRAAILRMDALSVLGKAKDAAAIASSEVISKLPSDNASLLKNFQVVVAPPAKDPAEKLESLHSLTETVIDPWVGARVWLEIGNTLAMKGELEEAVKAWLRVPVFFPAERDLAFRGTILAARGLQQINRPQDGKKLLDDYQTDHIGSPYKETLLTEAAKLAPKNAKETPEGAR